MEPTEYDETFLSYFGGMDEKLARIFTETKCRQFLKKHYG